MKQLFSLDRVKTVLAVAFAALMLVLNTLVTMTAMKKMGLFLAFVMCLTFLHCPPKRGNKEWKPGVFDFILSALGASIGLYIFFTIEAFYARYFSASAGDYLFAALAIVLILEAGRRVLGNVLPIVAIAALLYAFLGAHMPGVFRTGGFTVRRILEFLYMRPEGIFGVTLQTAASYIALFIIFGAIINETRVGEYLILLSQAIAGRATGGPAKVAVVSSALMGTVSGSPIANVVTTGTFTIPLMKKVGFEAHMAGATEAAASTGGSIMPPIMASAAFIMAEYLGIPYFTIAVSAIVPALCYYLSIYINVHFYSVKHGLVGMKTVPSMRDMLRQIYLLLPIAAVFYVIFAGMTPLRAALWGIISSVVVSQFDGRGRLTLPRLVRALGKSSLTGIEAYIACIIVGIPVGVIVMTGLGNIVADFVLGVSGTQVIVVLVVSAAAALVMSMGLPTVPLYIVCATTVAPALVGLKVLPLAAHMFVLYWGVLSNLTPPVALASYAAAGLSGGSLNKVALSALKLTLPTFLIPFAFVIHPAILLQNADLVEIITSTATLTIGSCALAVAVAGYTRRQLGWVERIILGAGAVLLIDPGRVTDIIGGAIVLVMMIVVFWKKKEQPAALAGRPGGRR